MGSSRAVTWGMRCLSARTLNWAARTVRFSSSAWRIRTSKRLRTGQIGNRWSVLARGFAFGLLRSHLIGRLKHRGADALVVFRPPSRGRRCSGILAEIDAPEDPEQEGGRDEQRPSSGHRRPRLGHEEAASAEPSSATSSADFNEPENRIGSKSCSNFGGKCTLCRFCLSGRWRSSAPAVPYRVRNPQSFTRHPRFIPWRP